ncbi:MAG: tetratricopeptide repeat protein, partial [Phycisphaerales bacterium]|nr:tetratricopeptide repeat protein [Phycisphaerales bacterium]
MTCPSIRELEAMASGTLPEEIEAHLESCARCRARMEHVQRNEALMAELAGMRRGDLLDAFDAPPEQPIEITGYRLVSELHRGGQGVIHKAVHESSHRDVAIKTLLSGRHATERQRRRFEREVELVARLRHPGIVTLYDSGVDEAGRPWLAMEYIRGERLDRAVERLRGQPDWIRRTVDLMAQVCEAVNHAHQRGIIHRDLKPANILVEGTSKARVLDFGVAKTFGQGARPDATMTSEFVGTLAYAAPEQVSGDPDQIDIRTDVYAIGAMLYELLTATSTIDVTGSVADVVRAITREDAPRASSIAPEIGRELDAILERALRKERESRYQTAGELGEDLRRFLAGEPIEARRDQSTYLIRKLVRRHRTPVALGAIAVVLLVLVVVVMSVLYSKATTAERDARRQRERAVEHLAFYRDLFDAVDPDVARGRDNTLVRELLDEAAVSIQDRFADDPDTEREIRTLIGRTYLRLAELDRAAAQLDRAATLAPDDDVDQALGELRLAQERFDEAERLLRGVVEARTDDPLGQLEAIGTLGVVEWRRGDFDQAAILLRQAAEQREALLGPSHLETIRARVRLAAFVKDHPDENGPADEWDALLDALDHDSLAEHPLRFTILNDVGVWFASLGEYGRAEGLLRESLDGRMRLRETPPLVAESQTNLANTLIRLGAFDEAQHLLEDAIETKVRYYGETHSLVASSITSLALFHYQQGRLDEASAMLRRALLIYVAQHNVERVFDMRTNLAAMLVLQDRNQEALVEVDEALSWGIEHLGDDSHRLAPALNHRARILLELGRLEEAEADARHAIRVLVAYHGDHYRYVGIVHQSLGAILLAQERPADALAALDHAVEIIDDLANGEVERHSVRVTRAEALVALERFDEARPILEEAARVFDEADATRQME